MVPIISRLFICKTAIYRPGHVLSRKLHEEAINVRWEKPEIGWKKLNFDGSCKSKTGEATAIYRPGHLLSRKLHEEAINGIWEKPEIGWKKLNFDGSCKSKTGEATATYRPGHVLSRKLHEEGINVRWEKPEIGWKKLNFDGSCKSKTGEASIGGIFRNHNAEFLLGYAEFIGQSNSAIAELVAMRKGLDHVLENRWDYILIEGDSKSIIDVISRKREAKCKEMQMHVSCIQSMLREIKNCVLAHVFREGNMAADRFAQMGHQLLKPQIWHEPPKEVLDIVKDDAIGKMYYRLK